MPKRIPTTAISLFLTAIAVLSQAQSFRQPSQQPQPLAAPPQDARASAPEAGRVELYVTVFDGEGRVVKDLQKHEFRVFEDGHEQPFELLAQTAPLVAALLVDTSGSGREVLWPVVQASAVRFFRSALRPGDSASVIGFAEEARIYEGGTDDPAALALAITTATAKPSGPTALYDTVKWTCKKLRPDVPKVLVIVSDGFDTVSRSYRDKAVEAALQAHTTIYALALPPAKDSGEIDRRLGRKTLSKLAAETGGFAVVVNDENELNAGFDRIAEALRGRYLVSYSPVNPNRHTKKFFKRKVQVARPGVVVSAAKGYFSPKKNNQLRTARNGGET